MEKLCRDIADNISRIDRRLMWICGAAACLGTVLGTVAAVAATKVLGG